MNEVIRNQFLLGLTVMLLCSVALAAPDSNPPYLSSPLPPPGATDVAINAMIMATVSDDGSGINPLSIVVELDGVIIEPIIEPADNDRCAIVYNPSAGEEYAYGARKTVAVWARDWDGNELYDTWYFEVTTSRAGGSIVEPVRPLSGTWLIYDRVASRMAFTWSTTNSTCDYRLKVTIEDQQGTNNYEAPVVARQLERFGSIVSFSFPITEEEWVQLSKLNRIMWQIAPVEPATNQLLGHYSRAHEIHFAPTDSIKIYTPRLDARLNATTIPVLKWEADTRCVGYVYGAIRVDEHENPVGDPIISDIPFFVKQYEMPETMWATYESGKWLWTIVGVLPDQTFTSCMLNSFIKQ